MKETKKKKKKKPRLPLTGIRKLPEKWPKDVFH